MRKNIIIGLSCILAVLLSMLVWTYIKQQEKENISKIKNDINLFLSNQEYEQVFSMISEEYEKYIDIINDEIDNYAIKLCDESRENLSLEKLTKFKDAGGDYSNIIDTINEIETKLSMLKISSENYEYAVLQYNSRNYEDARVYFETVVEDDVNYQSAQEYIEELNLRDSCWDENISGKSSFLNACTFDGNYLYIPYILDGVDGIYKITKDGVAVDFFPLSNEAGRLVISSINVVGEYIYFIAGENVGSGYTFTNPYCIYEMKTDGTALTLAVEGNFTDLFIKGDKVYAISRDYGLIEIDRNFYQQSIISDGIISELSVCDEGVYYTVQEDLTYDNVSSVYFYDGSESVLVDTKEYIHYYQFDDIYIKQWKNNNIFEILCYGDGDSEIGIRNADIYKLYGILEGKVFYSCNGSLGREIPYTYDLDNGLTNQIVESKVVLDYKIKGVFYEQDKLLIEKDGKLYFSDIIGLNRQEISNIQMQKKLLESNSNIIKHLNTTDTYTSSSDEKIISVIYDKQNWHYKDDNLNITIEKRYREEYDCNVYVTHIFTTDYTLLTTGNAKTDSLTASKTYKASSISDKYQAIYAQNTDTFVYHGNINEGMIIRQGQIVREVFLEDMIVIFDDGSMELYRAGDPIDAQTLMDKGAATSFSFGPILVEDYNVLSNCVNVKLADRNPRSAIGYVEQGHYIMVACDGRDPEVSRGLNMIQLARIFEDEGCKIAYNLDGGMTSTVLFMGNYITHRPPYSSGSEWFFYRSVAELFYVGTSELSPASLDLYQCDYNYFLDNYK